MDNVLRRIEETRAMLKKIIITVAIYFTATIAMLYILSTLEDKILEYAANNQLPCRNDNFCMKNDNVDHDIGNYSMYLFSIFQYYSIYLRYNF